MAKEQKNKGDIPRPKEDVIREKENGSFKKGLADFVKKTEKRPKK